jgi:1-deoxy-D-xylulose-5-phosphate reductoisomerase
MKRILLLGATGSIGRSTLDLVRAHPDRFRLVGIAACSSARALARVARDFDVPQVALSDEEAARDFRDSLGSHVARLHTGPEAVASLVGATDADLCVSALVGSAGLAPTLIAIEGGMDVALANKESLVAGGALVTEAVRSAGVRLLPVDSEHSALFQLLEGRRPEEIRRLWITGSGGPFRGCAAEALRRVSPEEALAHPTWRMGRKVSVDSATLANKALEVIEAHWLFGLPYESLGVLIHPQSVVHGLAELTDGSMLAHMGPCDMRLPIQYALCRPERLPSPARPLDLATLGRLEFEEPDHEVFPLLRMGIDAGRAGGTAPAAFSAANEEAVALFLENRLDFPDIATSVRAALDTHAPAEHVTLETIRAAERRARATVKERVPV